MNKKRLRLRYSLWLSLLIATLVNCLALYGLLETLELKTVDSRFLLRGKTKPAKEVVIVVADELAINRIGRWPWPRNVHAKLVQKLSDAGAMTIIFDLIFPEPDRYNVAGDREFAQAILESNRVIMGLAFQIKGDDPPQNPLLPIPELLHAASGLGHVNHIPGSDGVGRTSSMFADYQGIKIPSISFAGYALLTGQSPEELVLREKYLKDDSSWNKIELNFYGDFESFPIYSYWEVLSSSFPAGAFENKAVLVGGTATALFDRIAVPNEPVYAGVGLHATALSNYIDKNYLRRLPLWVTLAEIWLVCVILGFILAGLSPWMGALAVILSGTSQFGLCYWLFAKENINMQFVPPVVAILGVYVIITFQRLITEEKEKRWIKNTFSQYLSPKVIEVITADPSKLRLGGEEKNMTVFFSDLAGFTTMSESLKPQELVTFLNIYLTEMTEIVFRHAGVVDKYIGDAIMAFWNAPLDQEQHAILACLAAIESQERLVVLQEELTKRGFPAISSRIGVNTGYMVVGNMGSRNRFDYTVMGDAVNLASRLEGANKIFGTKIMISEFTCQMAKDMIEVRELDLIRVKGKIEPIKVFELVTGKGKLSPNDSLGFAAFHEGLAYYRDRRFAEAWDKFKDTLKHIPNDKVSKLYIERCQKYESAPPPSDWDGVFVMTTK